MTKEHTVLLYGVLAMVGFCVLIGIALRTCSNAAARLVLVRFLA
jgi:hypothetical protein